MNDDAMMRTHVGGIADALNELLSDHETIVHGGDPCPEERANVLAYLAHRLGVRDKGTVVIFLDRLASYEVEHEAREHDNGGDL